MTSQVAIQHERWKSARMRIENAAKPVLRIVEAAALVPANEPSNVSATVDGILLERWNSLFIAPNTMAEQMEERPYAMTTRQFCRRVCQYISDHEAVELKDILSERRLKPIVRARHICIYLIYELTNISYPQLGVFFMRDHTTALHAVDAVTKRLRADASLALRLDAYKRDLEPFAPIPKDAVQNQIAPLTGKWRLT